MMKLLFLFLLMAIVIIPTQGMNMTESAGLQIFPEDNILNVRINNTTLFPTHSCSTQWMQSQAWTSSEGTGSPVGFLFDGFSPSYGIPINLVNNSVANITVYIDEYAAASDFCNNYTYPGGGLTIGTCNASWGIPLPSTFIGEPGDEEQDKHGIVINYERGIEYDLFHSPKTWNSTVLQLGSTAIFNLSSNWMRGGTGNYQMDGKTYTLPRSGTGVGGNSIAQLLVTPGEIEDGVINHALYVTVAWAQNSEYLWPARAGYNGNCVAGKHNTYWCPPYGARARIKSSVDLSHYAANHPQAYVVLTALKEYGAIIQDNSYLPYANSDRSWTLWGSGDVIKDGVVISDASVMFDRTDLDSMTSILVDTDTWEFVDEQSAMIDFNSGKSLYNESSEEESDDPLNGWVPENINGTAPLIVNFYNYSYNVPTSFSYSFKNTNGNNTWIEFGTTADSNYTFTENGNYQVRLNVSNSFGSNTSPSSWVNITGGTNPDSLNFLLRVYNFIRQFFMLGRLI